MNFKADIDPDSRGFFYADSGDDTWNGQTIELPKQTIQAAINAGSALSPTPGDTARVKEAQGGVYSDGITLANSVIFEGLQTAIITSDAIAVTAANDITCDLQAAINNSVGGVGLSINGSVNFAATLAAVRTLADNGIAVEIKNTVDNIFVKVTQMVLDGDGSIGFKITSSHDTALDLNSDVFIFGDINQTFFEYDAVNTTDLCDLNISTVESDSGGGAGGYAGSKGIIVRNGDLKVRIGSLSAKTFVEVESGGRLSLQGNAIEGNTVIKTSGQCVYDSLSIIDGNLNTEGTGLLQARVSNIIGDATLTDTSTMSIKADQFIGELIVGVSSTLFAFIDTYTGTLPPDDGRVNGLINGIPFGTYRIPFEDETVLTAFSSAIQTPSGLGTPLKVEFGALQTGDAVDLAASGTITINEDEQYIFKYILQPSRTTNGGVVFMFVHLEVDGTQEGESQFFKMNGPNDDPDINFTSDPLNLTENQTVDLFIVRSSLGVNEGFLVATDPSVSGWNASRSASVTVTKVINA